MDCDTSNSSPLPSVQWLNPQGVMIENDRSLEIKDIQRDAAGVYTCIATSLDGETLNITVNVTVQCEYETEKLCVYNVNGHFIRLLHNR